MEEMINNFLNKYIGEHPGYIISDQLKKSIKENLKSFEDLSRRYMINMNITGEGAFEIQFSTETGAVQTSYAFYKAVISNGSSDGRSKI